nr:uncharacterized protein LOC117223393 [Megalopta genalis]
MQVLRWIFKLITLCGCWRPASWDSTPRRYLYNVYTMICFMITHLFVVGEVLDLVLIVDNQNDLAENLYATMGAAVTCYKLSSMVSMRESLAIIMNTLESEPFTPEGDRELEIRTKFDKSAEERKTVYRVWLPFDHTPAITYCLVYLHHTLVTIANLALTIAYDSLYAGLLVHIYSQFEILRHRLQNVHRNENNSVKHCARHHDQIYKLVPMLPTGRDL